EVPIGLRKLLPALGEHVRHGIDVDWLILVIDEASEITNFQRDLAAELALDSQVKRIDHVRSEVRVKTLACSCGSACASGSAIADSRIQRLRQSCRSSS